MLQAYWQEHRPFIVRVAGGAAVFLVLMNLAMGYRSDGVRSTSSARNDLVAIEQELNSRDGQHLQEKQNAVVYAQRGDDFLLKVSLHGNAEVKAPAEDVLSIDFARRLSGIWATFKDVADDRFLTYPDQNDLDFDLSGNLSSEEWRDRYAILEVLRRFLFAANDAQFSKISKIVPGVRKQELVIDDSELVLARYPIRVEVICKFSELLAFTRSFQKDRDFLSIEVGEMTPVEGNEEELSVELTVVGIDLEEPREEAKTTRSSSRRNRRGGF